MRKHLNWTLASAALLALCAAGPTAAAIPQDLQLVPFVDGLDSPVALRHAGDGSGRVYVVEQSGAIRAFSAEGAALGTVLDFGTSAPPHGFSSGGERGLLGLAFHPAFPVDARLFVYYTDGNGDTVVASYTVAGDPPVASSPQVLLRVDQDFSNHNGGDIHFGDDGYLYIALGDGGSGNDPCNRAQTLDPAALVGADAGGSSNDCAADSAFLDAAGSFPGNPDSRALLGKILRIDVDGSTAAGDTAACGGATDGSAPYAIPASNPFVAAGCGEVWHYGLRNPYRFSFDRATGDLFIGDVGQNAWEEIDIAAAGVGGLDFGWKLCEGSYLRGTATPCTAAGSTLPILDYARAGGQCAVSGGYRYRGPIATLQRHYIYGDFCSGRIWIASGSSSGKWSARAWQVAPLNISGFGEDESGALYVIGLGGSVMRFEAPDAVFGNSFEGP